MPQPDPNADNDTLILPRNPRPSPYIHGFVGHEIVHGPPQRGRVNQRLAIAEAVQGLPRAQEARSWPQASMTCLRATQAP